MTGQSHPPPDRLTASVQIKKNLLSKRPRKLALSVPYLRVFDVDDAKTLESHLVITGARILGVDKELSISLETTVPSPKDGKKGKFKFLFEDKDDYYTWLEAMLKATQWSYECFYSSGEFVGNGHYAMVYKGKNKENHLPVACKVVTKAYQNPEIEKFVDREYELMPRIEHENVLSTKDVFETHDTLKIVVEYVSGGPLFDVIEKDTNFNEKFAANIMKQVFFGLKHLHDQDLVHRDVKPDNILCETTTHPIKLKISDFGLRAFLHKENDRLMFEDDSWFYGSPELMLSQKSGKPVDMWAAGVVLYMIISGKFPFEGSDKNTIKANIRKGLYAFPDEEWADISDQAKDMVKGLLNKNAGARLTVEQALHHDWMKAALNITKNLSTTSRMTSLKVHNEAARKKKEEENKRLLELLNSDDEGL
mmetsp:Transcript_15795/g.40591  ORF Transcript_15795/g.40591 Transcript_15795/m.40591 type:complete len:421 (-) Transcript_15795:527-1789(-)|eukprot:CAMPEP_0184724444 /NCGR_PEP_ID=MMETSP0314-20130426/27942_1 /TAXON_ID=38298 /ORGANISM="Rhodella maculata, Strain CCMP 736" /LENGTH=420 /DNA_ID=CAMNT_0027189439 /DNA_START=37 /DNA_END=1299 /DNA_ORIENTATION=+